MHTRPEYGVGMYRRKAVIAVDFESSSARQHRIRQ